MATPHLSPTFSLHRMCCKYGTFADDLGPPLSQEAALSRFSGAATLVASPLSPFWLEDVVYGTAAADALCALLGTERLHLIVNLERGSVQASRFATMTSRSCRGSRTR